MSEKRAKPGYDPKASGICVVAYDIAGKPISQEVAKRVVKAVEKATEKERLGILYTQQ
jgi:hypothetical protein